MLVAVGVVLVVVGLVLIFGRKIPLLSRLDFHFHGKGWDFYFPLGTCILVSLVLTLVFWLLRRH